MSPSGAVSSFIRAVPKVELHLHLVGSASPSTVAALALARPAAGVPSDPDELSTLFEFRDFEHFIEVYASVNSLVTSGEAIAHLIDGAALDLSNQNVRYAEMTITPYSHVTVGVAYPEVVEGLDEGWRRAKARGVDFAWVFDIPGEMGLEAAEATVLWATTEPPDRLVAFGLGGIEAGVDRSRFTQMFDRARATGLRSVPHAGEADGPASIWAALGFLRADRIGHGVRAIEDDRLLRHLVDNRIPLEVCPSSNVCTQVYPTIADHPVGLLIDAGAVVTINTDDPPMFATTLNREYEIVAAALELDIDGVADLVRAGVEASFLTEQRKRDLLDEITAVEQGFEDSRRHGLMSKPMGTMGNHPPVSDTR